jgi:protoporphyrinogen oxidase
MEQNHQKQKTAIIIGAGPAGLTAAYELLLRTDIKPIILEKSADIGGISKTVNYKGNRIDLGGHRFFSKSDRVMKWWLDILPVQSLEASAFNIKYHGRQSSVENSKHGSDPDKEDKVFLIRHRLSRIFYLRKFFNYPVSADFETLTKLGFRRSVRIVCSYIWSQIFPKLPEVTLEDFFINRFGKELYNTFFKDYTEKVWGKPPIEITADWGKQRVKSLSISKAIIHSFKKIFRKKSDIYQKETETSLIEQFLYPKYGPGQMWEEVAQRVVQKGGEVLMNQEVTGINLDNGQITCIQAKDKSGNILTFSADYYFSTMPVKDLINAMGDEPPDVIKTIANGLDYRDFITTGLLLNKLKKQPGTIISTQNNIVPDNWIYVQENDVKLGRIQVINNWSPYMAKDNSKVWLGLEYFCNEGDELWNLTDEKMTALAISELEKIGIVDASDVIDSTVIRMAKTYPGYFGSYNEFGKIVEFTDQIENLFLIGRNGMHKYNNQDHSMLTAMTAVDNIINGISSKANIWAVNTEEEYHEAV